MKNKMLFLKLKIIGLSIAMFFTFATLIVVPVYAWLAGHSLTIYAPVNTATSLYIGAGNQEDIRYLSFEGIDATSSQRYVDYVFSVSGEFVRHYKIQLAFTTNNEFTFDLFRATTNASEKSTDPAGEVIYTTHPSSGNPQNIKYYIEQNGKINGSYKNQDGSSIIGIMGSSNNYYKDTYDTYTNVDKNAVPLYWQTNATIETGSGATFNHYFILRLYIGNKQVNDRETDIICIAARVFSSQITE